MQAIEGAIRDEGWKMVMLLRLSPILPFALLNYGLSVTPISAWTYTWASAVGIIPGVLQLLPVKTLDPVVLSSVAIADCACMIWMARLGKVIAAGLCRNAAVRVPGESGE